YAPWLSRHYRVITIDPRGNGRSDRPADPDAYGASVAADDTLAVLDELSVERAVLHGTSWAALPVLFTNLKAPERVAGLVLMGPLLPVGEPYDDPITSGEHFFAPLDEYEGNNGRTAPSSSSGTRTTSTPGCASPSPSPTSTRWSTT